VALAFQPGLSLSRRRLWISFGFMWGCLGFALCIAGVYLPMLRMADAVRG
jgi:hypothetical protein